jgi:Xaa-Pro aminopeptidase
VTRAERVQAGFAEHGIDALLVTHLVNVRYLTGFTGSNAMVVLGPDRRRFITDFRYVSQAAVQVGEEFEREQGPQDFVGALGEGWPEGALRLGFEDQHLSVRQHARIAELVPESVELVSAGGLVEDVRLIKEPGEVEAVRAAAALADDALQRVLEQGLGGRTERAVAIALEEEMRRLGAAAPSFPTIVASGAHGALPHAEPREVPVEADTLVTIDWGARLDGYHSDCTRTFALGAPPEDLLAVYALVHQAQAAGLAAVRPGPKGSEVDAVARDIIEAAGHGERFGHGLGHGVGLDVHEEPRLSRTGDRALAAGNVVTVEPGVYLPGRGGVRIEDLVVVRPDGHEVLSGLPKALTHVD